MSSRRFPDSGVSRDRRGFTLVELMTVIVIIGILMALISVVAFKVLVSGKEAVVKVELDGLATAIESYKQQRSAYPPSFAAYDTGLASEGMIMRHLATAFPRWLRDADGDGDHDYDDFVEDVRLGTILAADDPATSYDDTDGLDANDLDQAEAVVFWLAGLPSRTTENKTVGFSTNPNNPFENGEIGVAGSNPNNRTRRMFEFDAARLVDFDRDGWWEYVPDITTTGGQPPPYVYFDATTYNLVDGDGTADAIAMASYPSDESDGERGPVGNNGDANMLSTWGRAWPWLRLPYDASATPPVLRNQWINSDSFQLLCTGLDGLYDNPDDDDAPHEFHDVDTLSVDHPLKDNLTSFGEGTIAEQDERSHANEQP